MLPLLFLLLLTVYSAGAAEPSEDEEPVLASMLWTPQKGYEVISGKLSDSPDTVAWANFTNAINQTGWSYLEVKTNERFPDNVQAYAAGFLEGQVTSEVLYLYWRNTVDGYCDGKEAVCERIKHFLRNNTAWIKSKVAKYRDDNPYWHQVALFYDQLDGLVHGYKSRVDDKRATRIPDGDVFWMNVFGDLEDLEMVFAKELNLTNFVPRRVLGSGHCSALVKILPNNTDLYVSQDTWNSYQSMTRVLKRYDLGFHWSGGNGAKKLIPGQSMSFSSYPGVIYSGDDFSLISSGLAVMETTIGNGNGELWSFVKPESVLEGVRATVANRMARNGVQWTKIFSKRNSGTYNNQWMVIDYKLFKPGKSSPTSNLLWVLEQLPGHVHAEDVTPLLLEQTYFPSYNSPYFKDIFNLSGNPALVAKYGDWFSYDKTPRALIFKRDHAGVVDLGSMTRLMRYNDFRKDPLAACECSPPFSAENAISARNDLNPKNGSYPFPALGHRSHGGTDMKLTSSAMFQRQEFLAVSGPTHDDQPAFRWSQVDFGKDTPHFGHPDLWQFEPVQHSWTWK